VSMTRRDAIKAIGASAALVGLGGVSGLYGAPALLVDGVGATKQPFVLPPLGYGFDALEPHIDTLTMQIHYSKHHATYIKNANKALEDHPVLANLTAEEILGNLASVDDPLRGTLKNNVGGHVNHSFFWKLLSPKPAAAPTGVFAGALTAEFGSLEAFKPKFAEAALKRFGSGWAWLCVKGGKLSIHSTANQDSPISEGAAPVIGLDVWEHAYYLKHQNVRADYVEAFWSVLDWDQAGSNYAAAIAAKA
jgi:superoxide dismutase, Fe-Mn family